MRKLIILCCLMTFGTSALALTAFTDKGRWVTLNSDGTWNYLEVESAENWQKLLQFMDFFVEHDWITRTGGPFGDTVLCYPQFKNMTDKTITGLILNLRYLDGTNELLHEEEDLRYNVLIRPGETNSVESYLYYDKTHSRNIYLKLKDGAMAGTLKVTLCIKRIAFNDGSNLDFLHETWRACSAADSKIKF